MKKVIEYLKQLGLTEIEATLYQTLLQMGPTTVKELADRANIKRITAHFNIESLINKGLVTQTMEGARRKIIAESPQNLATLIEQKENEIKKMRIDYHHIIESLSNVTPKTAAEGDIDIVFYEGIYGVRSIYKRVLHCDELRSYVNIGMIYDLFPENPQLFPENVDEGNLKMWEIIEDSARSREYLKTVNPERYFYKFFPDNIDKRMFFDYMIFDGHVAIITAENKQPKGILINNKNIYLNSKFVFDLVWSLLPEVKSSK